MINPDTKLLESLFTHGIGLEPCEKDTLILKAVPVHPRYFNKPKTNVLLRHVKSARQYLVFVDEDLEFQDDKQPELLRIFKSKESKNGWRLLHFDKVPVKTPTDAIRMVMETLWAGEPHPAMNEYAAEATGMFGEDGEEQPILKAHAIDLGKQIAAGVLPPTIGREREMELAIAILNKWEHPRLPIIVSEAGVGRTNLTHGVARQILSDNPEHQIFALDLPRLLAGKVFHEEREELFLSLFNEMAKSKNKAIFIMEDIDLMLNSCHSAARVLCTALNEPLKLIATLQAGYEHLFADPVLQRRVQLILLEETSREDTLEIIKGLKPLLEKHHQVKIMENALSICVNSAGTLPGKFPAKAIHLLDLACARVHQSETATMAPDDVVAAASLCERLGDEELLK